MQGGHARGTTDVQRSDWSERYIPFSAYVDEIADLCMIAKTGGHTKPASYRSIFGNVEALGLEEALKITRLEQACMQQTHAFAKDHNIDCDAKLCDTVDLVYDQAQWDAALKAIGLVQKSLNSTQGAARHEIWSSAEAEKRFLCKDAIGAITHEAGSISAYKFVIGILKLALDLGLILQTNTPATSLRKDLSNGWTVGTPRGTIQAAKVILATNGYTAYLYPKLQGKIVPMRGQITAHRPGNRLPNDGSLDTTYSFIYANGYDYMIPRPSGSLHAGDIVIGGGLVKAADEGLQEYGMTDDQTLNADVSKHLQESTEQYFGQNWGQDAPEGRIRKEWTGIMGYSADGYPMIGELPGEKDLWICASFQGHGTSSPFIRFHQTILVNPVLNPPNFSP